MNIEDYLRQQNKEQREELDEKDETIKALQKENYEVKQSICEKLEEVSLIGHSNNLHKNIEMLDIIDNLVEELKYDIKEELVDDCESIN